MGEESSEPAQKGDAMSVAYLCVSFLTANNKGNHTGWQYATTGNIAEGD